MEEITEKLLDDIYGKLVNDEGISELLKLKGIDETEFKNTVLHSKLRNDTKIKKEKVEITDDMLKEFVSNSYDDGWKNKKNVCIFFYSSVVPTGLKPFTMCGKDCDGIYCEDHYPKKKDKTLDAFNRGKLDREYYHSLMINKRKNFGKSKLKAKGATAQSLKMLSTKRMLATKDYAYLQGHKRDIENGLVVEPIDKDLTRIYYSVGIDRKNNGKMRKLNASDVRKYEDTNVTFAADSLDEDAIAYLMPS